MTAELVHGQNHPLPATRLEIRITADRPVVAGATFGDGDGKVRGTDWVAHPGAPTLPGLEVPRQAAAEHHLAVDLDALPEAVERVHVLLALPMGVGGPERFGAIAPPRAAVTGLDGAEIATFAVTGLDSESAVTTLELYLRKGAWKIRAIGQGYAGGLEAMLADHGLPAAPQLAAEINAAVAAGIERSFAAPPSPAAGGTDGTGWRAASGVRGAVQGSGGATDAAAAGQGPGATAPAAGGQDTGADGVAYSHPRRSRPPGPDAGAGTGPGAGSGDPTIPGTGPVDYQHPSRPEPAPGPGGQFAGGASGPGAPAAPPPPAAGAGTRAPTPIAGDAAGWSMEERLYNQVWGMFEDLARTVAAYRSAVDFAESRMDRELESVLSDPRTRMGPAADAAREAARSKHADLVGTARAALERDIAQLEAEAEVVEPALPPPFAGWESPTWHGYQVPGELPLAVRLGDLRLPETSGLRIPMLVRLPLERGLWIDSGRSSPTEADFIDAALADPALADPGELRARAARTAVAHAARLLATYPPGELSVQVIDAAGTAAPALTPLLHSGVLADPPPTGAAGVQATLDKLTQRVDLVQMAVRSGAADSLPPDLDVAEQLLIVHDFPHGFDDRAVTQLRYLADEGPTVGVHLLLVADREDTRGFGPVLDPLFRTLLRLTPVPDDHLADPWVGHAWTYEPSVVPAGSQVLTQVLGQVAAARRLQGR